MLDLTVYAKEQDPVDYRNVNGVIFVNDETYGNVRNIVGGDLSSGQTFVLVNSNLIEHVSVTKK